ncbi:MAG: hypothetical protein ACE5Z5_04810 [Candidatus Bathyarchaeia archaeon]
MGSLATGGEDLILHLVYRELLHGLQQGEASLPPMISTLMILSGFFKSTWGVKPLKCIRVKGVG